MKADELSDVEALMLVLLGEEEWWAEELYEMLRAVLEGAREERGH